MIPLPEVPLRDLVVRHGDGGAALQARHHHLQQEARAALLHPRKHQVSKRAKAQPKYQISGLVCGKLVNGSRVGQVGPVDSCGQV